jgi:hypothetical protein
VLTRTRGRALQPAHDGRDWLNWAAPALESFLHADSNKFSSQTLYVPLSAIAMPGRINSMWISGMEGTELMGLV